MKGIGSIYTTNEEIVPTKLTFDKDGTKLTFSYLDGEATVIMKNGTDKPQVIHLSKTELLAFGGYINYIKDE